MDQKKKYSFGFLWILFLQLSITVSAQTVQDRTSVFPDSVTAITSIKYRDPSFLKKIFMGKNYRKEWETPVRLPVLNLTTLGLTVKELGGGKQTKSLRLADRDSVEWALRSVDKDVHLAVPKIIRINFT